MWRTVVLLFGGGSGWNRYAVGSQSHLASASPHVTSAVDLVLGTTRRPGRGAVPMAQEMSEALGLLWQPTEVPSSSSTSKFMYVETAGIQRRFGWPRQQPTGGYTLRRRRCAARPPGRTLGENMGGTTIFFAGRGSGPPAPGRRRRRCAARPPGEVRVVWAAGPRVRAAKGRRDRR